MNQQITWLTVPEAARHAKRSTATIRRALESGEMSGEQSKARAHWRVDVRAVDAWIRGERFVERVTTGRKRGKR